MTSPPAHPVLSCADAKAWEAGFLKDEAAEWDAMQRAAGAIACAILGDFSEIGGLPDDARLMVLVGKGHNGGDALLVAKILLETRPQARADVIFAFGEDKLKPLVKRSWELLRDRDLQPSPEGQRPANQPRVRVVSLPLRQETLATAYALCVDGIFGFQFRPPLDHATAEVLAKVNSHPRIRLRAAVDLPSGMGAEENADTVFRADFTYAPGIVKSPVLASANAAYVGRLRYLDLGFFAAARPPPAAAGHILLPSILHPLAGLRPAQSDKRTYGHLFVVGGSRSYPGAILMTVQAALRSGVGLLTAFIPRSLAPEYAARFPEAMWVGCPQTDTGGLAAGTVDLIREKLPRATALVAGPGLGPEPATMEMLARLVADLPVPLLLDADAQRPEIVQKAIGKPFILTPHAGELERVADLLLDRDQLKVPQSVIVAKGPITRILGPRPDGHHPPSTIDNATLYSLPGGPVLARGGSGDLLAGLIGGLLAQEPADLRLATCRGTVWHGLAADLLARDKGQVAVQTTQLLDYLQPALQQAS